ncbi:hypothetical protein [Paenibacillus sp. y28]|uniref:hypothetical protein n=1 Tax=Paenibacillus sp. y28 TaxID=3129110 RepID=UPI0030178136
MLKHKIGTGILLMLLIGMLSLLLGCESRTQAQGAAPAGSPAVSESPSPQDQSPAGGSAASGGQAGGAAGEPTPAAVKLGTVNAVRMIDPNAGWAGGSGWIARTDDGGKQWKLQYQGKQNVEQLFALNGQNAWAVLSQNEAKTAGSSASRTLLHTADGGKQWSPAGTVPNASFLHFVSNTEAFSGNARTTDGGKSWTTLPVPEHMAGSAYFHDAGNGWAVTVQNNQINVQRTRDGGKTWQAVMTRNTVAPVTDAIIRSAGTEDAWVELIGDSGMSQTSYSLFHTSDGGASWTTVIANSTAGAGPAPGFPADYNGGPKNAGSKPGQLYVVDKTTAFMGGYCPACDQANAVGWTTDGGKTWTSGKQQVPGSGGALLAMADASHGWWVTRDSTEASVLYTTASGGDHWVKTYTFDKP